MLCCFDSPFGSYATEDGNNGVSNYPGNRRDYVKTGGNALMAAPIQSQSDQLIAVTVQPGTRPGDSLTVVAPDGSGRTISATVPAGFRPGQTFHVRVPPPSGGAATPTQSPHGSTCASPVMVTHTEVNNPQPVKAQLDPPAIAQPLTTVVAPIATPQSSTVPLHPPVISKPMTNTIVPLSKLKPLTVQVDNLDTPNSLTPQIHPFATPQPLTNTQTNTSPVAKEEEEVLPPFSMALDAPPPKKAQPSLSPKPSYAAGPAPNHQTSTPATYDQASAPATYHQTPVPVTNHQTPNPVPSKQKLVLVKVPPGTAPGSTLLVQIPGENRTLSAKAPPGCTEFHMSYTPQVSLPAPIPRPAAPQPVWNPNSFASMPPPMPPPIAPVAPPGQELLLVRIPPGTAPGTTIHVEVPNEQGRVLAAQVPPNVTEFHVAYAPKRLNNVRPTHYTSAPTSAYKYGMY